MQALVSTLLLIISAVIRRNRNRFLRNLRLLSLQRRQRTSLLLFISRRQQNRRMNYRRAKRAWVYNRPQYWFDELLNNRNEDHLWHEHFRVSRNTFHYICGLVHPYMVKQDTLLREAIPKAGMGMGMKLFS